MRVGALRCGKVIACVCDTRVCLRLMTEGGRERVGGEREGAIFCNCVMKLFVIQIKHLSSDRLAESQTLDEKQTPVG